MVCQFYTVVCSFLSTRLPIDIKLQTRFLESYAVSSCVKYRSLHSMSTKIIPSRYGMAKIFFSYRIEVLFNESWYVKLLTHWCQVALTPTRFYETHEAFSYQAKMEVL